MRCAFGKLKLLEKVLLTIQGNSGIIEVKGDSIHKWWKKNCVETSSKVNLSVIFAKVSMKLSLFKILGSNPEISRIILIVALMTLSLQKDGFKPKESFQNLSNFDDIFAHYFKSHSVKIRSLLTLFSFRFCSNRFHKTPIFY